MTHIGHPRRWSILWVLIVALFAISLDNTILTIALPTLARDLRANTTDLQWMVDAYILVFAGLLLTAGALSDRFGRRLVLLIGLGLFGVGSAFAPLVTNPTQLIALRGFMGLGAALAMPSTLSIIADVFGEAERPKAIAAWGAVSALGIIVGPILGGVLLEHFHWSAVFLVNIPFVVIGVAATLAVVPESRAPGRVSLDLVGAAISVGALLSLVYGIIEAPRLGWGSGTVLGCLALAAILITAFIAWERRIEHPMLELRLFRDLRFSAASLSVTLAFFSLNGAVFFMSLYLQQIRLLGPLDTAYRFIPVAVGMIVSAPFSAPATIRFGARVVTAIGLSIAAVGLLMLAQVRVDTGDLYFNSMLVVLAFGLGLAMTPTTDAIMGALPKEKFGVGSAVNDTTREVGGALGVAVLGSLFTSMYTDRVRDVTALLPSQAADLVRGSYAGAAYVATQLPGDAGAALLAAARGGFIDALSLTSLVGAGFAIAGAVVALLFLPGRARKPAAREVSSVARMREEAA